MTQELQRKIYGLLKIYALPKLRYDKDLIWGWGWGRGMGICPNLEN